MRQDLSHINGAEDFSQLAPRTRRRSKTLEARPPLLESRIVGRSLEVEVLSGAHLPGEPVKKQLLLLLGPAEGPVSRP